MTALVATAAAFLVVATLAERLVRTGRTQSAAGRHLGLHALALALWAGLGVRTGLADPLAASLFWSGALVLWLGLRAHLESSILLTMAQMLAETGPAPAAQLQAACEARTGTAERLHELERGGFVRRAGGTFVLTPRGHAVVSAQRVLTAAWSAPRRSAAQGAGATLRGERR